MKFPNKLSVAATKRLAVTILAIEGTLFLLSMNIFSNALLIPNIEFAQKLSSSALRFLTACAFAVVGYAMALIASFEETPDEGHLHSKRNYLQSAFVIICISSVTSLIVGVYSLMEALDVALGQ